MAPKDSSRSENSADGGPPLSQKAPHSSSPWMFPPTVFSAPNGLDAHPSFATSDINSSTGPAPPPRSSQQFYLPHAITYPQISMPSHPHYSTVPPYTSGQPIHIPSAPEPADSGPSQSQLPLLPPIPPSDDEDLPSVDTLLKKHGKPVSKVAGARQPTKGKGKAKATDEYPDSSTTRGKKRKTTDDPSEEPQAKRARGRGRLHGSPNFYKKDLDILLRITREVLPIGARGWEEVASRFNEEAQKICRPSRPAKSLEIKVKNLAKATKPTGTAVVPQHIQQALEIDNLINSKVGTMELDDDAEREALETLSDSADEDEDGDNNDNDLPTPKPKSHFVARHSKPSRSRPVSEVRNNGQTFLTNIGLALDPSSRQARQDSLSLQYIQSQQIATLTQQLRDSQQRVDRLAAQLIETERRYQDAQRKADFAEMKSFLSSTNNNNPSHSHPNTAPSSQSQTQPTRPISEPLPPPIHNRSPRSRQLYRQDIFYPDGQATIWVGGESDDENYVTGINDPPGTRRVTYPDPRPYFPSTYSSSSQVTSSQQASSSDSRSSRSRHDPAAVDDGADTDCSQSL